MFLFTIGGTMLNKILTQSQVFSGMSEEEIFLCLKRLNSYEKSFQKNELIFQAGTTTTVMGMVLSGSVTIESNDIWGNRIILNHIAANGFFGESYALLANEILPVDVRANDNSHILFLCLDYIRSTQNCDSINAKLISNLLLISTRKNLSLSARIFHTSPKTIRDRLLSYFNSIAIRKKSREFDIPFDRQQLADYLTVERTALSKELGKLKKDGLIDYKKKHFCLMYTDSPNNR